MIIFNEISKEEFLTYYWQKKPLLLKQALPNFISPINPNELAELSLEDEIESRIVKGSIDGHEWALNYGPFIEKTYSTLPKKNWTLLVQGVDRFVDEVYQMIEHFDFVPRWRFDDVMASYAVTGGSVGPHFDYYDVFLLQGEGRRRWHLSTKNCCDNNYLDNVPLKIMRTFEPEYVFEVGPGDILYIPPKVAHHGVSLDDKCTTFSFGYRSYTNQELLESTEKYNSIVSTIQYYEDPTIELNEYPALITQSAINKAKKLVHISTNQFACCVTKIDSFDLNILQNFQFQIQNEEFDYYAKYFLHASCKIAYTINNESVKMYINGEYIDINDSKPEAITNFCNSRKIDCKNDDVFSVNIAKKLFRLGLLDKAI